MQDLANWQEGIYFGLPENIYHRLPWVGSSGMKTLYASPPDFWFDSPMNPLREPRVETFAKTFGTALHHRILYGRESFMRAYQRYDGEDGDSVSADGLKKWIVANGGAPAKLKADNERMVVEEFRTNLLTAPIYDKIMVASQMILKNPHLAQAFTGGWPEVSIFWIQDGMKCKARIDYLKLKSIVDLKSFRSKERTKTLDQSVLQDLFNYRYDIQVAHYQNGRTAARELFKQGKVFAYSGPRPGDEWLSKALATPEVGWVFVFYKADGMPISKSYQVPFGSPAHMSGRVAVETATAAWRDNMEKFGTDAWVNTDEPFQIAEEDMPRYL